MGLGRSFVLWRLRHNTGCADEEDYSALKFAGQRYRPGLTMVKTKPFDAAKVLDSPEMIAACLTEAFGSDDPVLMAMAIGAVARSQGMSAVAQKAGLSRENLYRALGGDAKPEFGTVIKVLHAPGMDSIAQPKAEQAA
jgi:probable addiction module antidote protein